MMDKKFLGKKQTLTNNKWLKAINNIENLVSKAELDILVEKTINDIRIKTNGAKCSVSYSAGKDSIVLYDVCRRAGITDSFIVISDLEFPIFLKWIYENKPESCTVINTGQNLEWLSKNQHMLFPKDSAIAGRWFKMIQHRGQDIYFKYNYLDMLILGRRKIDGNYVGKGDNIYTTTKGITRYSPLSEWKHEHILAYIHYYKLDIPPIYEWEDGYMEGTHCWPEKQFVEDIQDGWRKVYNIDKSIVYESSKYIDSAKEFLINNNLI